MNLLAVQGTLKNLLQHHNLKASIFVLNLLYDPTLTSIRDYWKTIALTRLNFVGKAMSLLFNMLSRFVIAFIPRSKYLLISWLHPLSTEVLESPKIQSITASIFSPFICHKVMGPEATNLVFWMFNFKPVFFTFSFHRQQEAFSSSPLSVTRVVSSAYLRFFYYSL